MGLNLDDILIYFTYRLLPFFFRKSKMKKVTNFFLLLCILFVSCNYKQIPFDKNQWVKEKNRFYMTESLIEKLNDEKPKRSEIFDLLGKPALEGRISNNEVSYWLKAEGFTIWELAIHFDNEGNFISAKVYRED